MKLMEDVYLENLIMHYDLDGLEIKLLQYISEGKDNTKIARKLKTTEAEVEELTKELYQKLRDRRTDPAGLPNDRITTGLYLQLRITNNQPN